MDGTIDDKRRTKKTTVPKAVRNIVKIPKGILRSFTLLIIVETAKQLAPTATISSPCPSLNPAIDTIFSPEG
jgi:hypothetical protein